MLDLGRYCCPSSDVYRRPAGVEVEYLGDNIVVLRGPMYDVVTIRPGLREMWAGGPGDVGRGNARRVSPVM